PIPYIVIGALVAVLAGVALLVITGNQISERKEQATRLRQEDAAAVVQAKQLAAYTQFQTLHEQRLATISNLADSRFDWERVMRELALILPHDVWLTELTASATAGTEGGGGGEGNLRRSILGPALELEGCAVGQEAVAGFVAALKDIDGVTRVGVESSELSGQEEGSGTSSGSSEASGGAECRTREFIAKFNIVVAFDAAPVPVTAEGEGEAPASATEAATTAASETESTESGSSEGQ
ncbi:MAG: PilN domain-containing protein, partial [Syntrophothermus sp.]